MKVFKQADTITVKLSSREVYSWAANYPEFGPKLVPLTFIFDRPTGDVLSTEGLTWAHDSAAIDEMADWIWSLMSDTRPGPFTLLPESAPTSLPIAWFVVAAVTAVVAATLLYSKG